MSEAESVILVHFARAGQATWESAAASEIVNDAIRQELLSVRTDFPDVGGMIPLRVRVVVEPERAESQEG